MAFLSKEMLSKATRCAAVKDHPLMKENISMNVRQACLQGCVLAVLMENDSVSDKARSALATLGKSLHLEEDALKDAITLVTGLADADKEQFVSEMLDTVKTRPVAQWFLFDFERMMGIDKPITKDSYGWLNHFGDVIGGGHGWRYETMEVCSDDECKAECFRLAKTACDAGDVEGMTLLGVAYTAGAGVVQNTKLGLRYLEDAARENYDMAQYLLGVAYESLDEAKKAFKCYLSAANHGLIDAQSKLGECYLFGRGTDEDERKGIEWLQRAAFDGGDAAAEAYGNLAACYLSGIGVEADPNKAYEWASKGAEFGDGFSLAVLARCHEEGLGIKRDEDKGMQLRIQAADAGEVGSQVSVGHMYLSGDGVDEDHSKAFSYFMKAAQQENAEAQNMVAVCYLNGDGIPENQEEYFSWVSRAAENGDVVAMNNLSDAYAKGLGCSADEQASMDWQRRAAEAGNADAQNALGVRYCDGDGVEEDEDEAFAWCNKAAEQELAIAQFNMGTFYENGHGCEADMEEALRWYQLAAAQDEPNALTRLGCYAADEEGDLKKAKRLLKKAARLGDDSAQEKLNELE